MAFKSSGTRSDHVDAHARQSFTTNPIDAISHVTRTKVNLNKLKFKILKSIFELFFKIKFFILRWVLQEETCSNIEILVSHVQQNLPNGRHLSTPFHLAFWRATLRMWDLSMCKSISILKSYLLLVRKKCQSWKNIKK